MRSVLRKPKHVWIGLLVVIAWALLLRIVYMQQLATNPFLDCPIVDSDAYDDMARRIVAGEHPTDGPFFQPPLYPYFLGLLYLILGHNLFAVRFAQMLLGVVNAGLCAILARRVFGKRIGVAAGLVCATYGTGLFFEGELLAPVLIIFLNLLLVLSMLRFLSQPKARGALIVGVLLGLSAITMAIVLPFGLVAAAYAARILGRRRPAIRRDRLLFLGAVYLLGIALPILPVTWYNTSRGDSALISTNAGINFYIGTGKDYDQKVGIRPGFQWQALGNEPIKAGYRKPTEQSKYFVNKGLRIIATDLFGYAKLLAKKMHLYAHGNEILRNQEIYPFRQYSWVLSLLLWKRVVAFPYGMLFPLAVLGLGLAVIQRKREAMPLVLFVAVHVAVLLLFFVAARYRMNVLPFMVMFAVFGVSEISRMFRARDLRRTAFALGALVSLFLLSNWPISEMPTSFNADAYYNLGVRYLKEDKRGARQLFEKAVALEPDYPEANSNLGAILDQTGEQQRAIACFMRVLSQYPDDIETNINLGNALFNIGDRDGAIRQFEKVLTIEPHNELALTNLSIVSAAGSRMEGRASVQDDQSKEKAERDAASLTNLGSTFLAQQEYAQAAEVLKAALRLAPGLRQAHNNLGIALAELGDLEGAEREFKIALDMDPNDTQAQANLKRLRRKRSEP